MKVCKVVFKDNQVLRPAWANWKNTHPAFDITYAKDKKTIPVIGKLFAYATLEDGERGLSCFDNSELWEAEAEDIDTREYDVFCAEDEVVVRILSFWENPEKEYPKLGNYYFGRPDGTVLCSNLTLIRKVK